MSQTDSLNSRARSEPKPPPTRSLQVEGKKTLPWTAPPACKLHFLRTKREEKKTKQKTQKTQNLKQSEIGEKKQKYVLNTSHNQS